MKWERWKEGSRRSGDSQDSRHPNAYLVYEELAGV